MAKSPGVVWREVSRAPVTGKLELLEVSYVQTPCPGDSDGGDIY